MHMLTHAAAPLFFLSITYFSGYSISICVTVELETEQHLCVCVCVRAGSIFRVVDGLL